MSTNSPSMTIRPSTSRPSATKDGANGGFLDADRERAPARRQQSYAAPRMTALLSAHGTIAVAGTAENQGRFYTTFDHVIYLCAPLEVLLDRVSARTNNPYGKPAEQQADIARYVHEVEPLIRRSATLELDALTHVEVLADRVEQCLLFPDRP